VKRFRYDVHALSGAYAVNAIDDDLEREKFERHLRRCQQCAGEVGSLTETAGRLGLAASQPPPDHLRDNVLSLVSQTRQLPPLVEPDGQPGRETARQDPARSRSARQPWSARRQNLVLAFGTASFAVVVALVITLVSVFHQLDVSRARDAALTAVLTAPDSRARNQTTTAGIRATVVYSLRKHAMIFTPHELPPLPAGKTYELWLIGPPQVRPAGLIAAGQASLGNPILASGVVRGDEVGVTVEPAGGSKKPTTTPVLVIPLSA
jgi:anti-sigma-K factor RskA